MVWKVIFPCAFAGSFKSACDISATIVVGNVAVPAWIYTSVI